jgi:glycosyltransferase involved in cell wall biosynthesis/SAM-dependent methyltransferase
LFANKKAMRLAYFSPLGPQRSGISDYSEELLPHLSLGADITLFVDGFDPTNQYLPTRYSILDYARDPSVLRSLKDFDAVLYHMGNDHRYHSGILQTIRAHPGIIVFHDFALQDFFMGLARQTGDLRVYLDELAACHGAMVCHEASDMLARGGTPSVMARPTEFPMNYRLARAAEGIIVHSQWSRSRFSEIAPTIPVACVAMPAIPLDPTPRDKTGEDPIRVASFGLITPGKGIEHALRALSVLKQTHDFRYTLVGDPSPFFDVRELIRKHNLSDRVHITGHVALEEFKRQIDETDIALNLRERTVGETSASLCRIMAAGVCSIVADVGWYSELPGDSVVKVPLDSHTDQVLVAYLTRLFEDASLRSRIGENARRHARIEHTFERSAEEYLGFIRHVISRRPRRSLISGLSAELTNLGIGPTDEKFLREVSLEVAALAPLKSLDRSAADRENGNTPQPKLTKVMTDEKARESVPASTSPSGRLPRIEGVDYKTAAIEYLGKLSPERSHHLRTKPFYNLANKPAKYKGEGMDEDMRRHFCDFANIAVALALPAGNRILDVGCGSGWLSEYFARLGYDVTGIDISPDLIEMSRERVERVPYGVDHNTPLSCLFEVHDIESGALPKKFDAIVCYDSLHHFENERAVMRNLGAMLDVGGILFILEGERPPPGSPSEEELRAVMREFQTLESPFDHDYLKQLLAENGFAVVGDYISLNGLFERDLLETGQLAFETLATGYHYLNCKKVVEGANALSIPDSRAPSLLSAQIDLITPLPDRLTAGAGLNIALGIKNTGDTLWLNGQQARPGVVMPAVQVFDSSGTLVNEFHGEPPLARAVAPGETINLKIEYVVPRRPGTYTLKIDLVAQHVCWFEAQGSKPLILNLEVTSS